MIENDIVNYVLTISFAFYSLRNWDYFAPCRFAERKRCSTTVCISVVIIRAVMTSVRLVSKRKQKLSEKSLSPHEQGWKISLKQDTKTA